MLKKRRAVWVIWGTAAVDGAATLGARVLVWAMGALPQRLALRIAALCVTVMRLFMPRIHRVGRRNLEIAFPEKSPAEREEILRKSYIVLAKNLLTFARLDRLPAEEIKKQYDIRPAAEFWQRLVARTQGTGLLLLTMHFGSFEQLAQAYVIYFRPLHILARRFGLKRFDRWWTERRQIHGARVFDRKGGYKEMIKRLHAGHDVAVLCDQNVKINHAAFIELFGMKAATTKSVALAAIRTGAPAALAVSVELEPERYTILAEEIPDDWKRESAAEDKVIAFLQSMHRIMEKFIRRHPEQWFWIHRRFKTRPPGEPETIYD